MISRRRSASALGLLGSSRVRLVVATLLLGAGGGRWRSPGRRSGRSAFVAGCSALTLRRCARRRCTLRFVDGTVAADLQFTLDALLSRRTCTTGGVTSCSRRSTRCRSWRPRREFRRAACGWRRWPRCLRSWSRSTVARAVHAGRRPARRRCRRPTSPGDTVGINVFALLRGRVAGRPARRDPAAADVRLEAAPRRWPTSQPSTSRASTAWRAAWRPPTPTGRS